MAIGVIVALPIMGQAIVRLGSVRATRIAGTICALVLPLPLLAPEPWLLPLALIVLGAASGAMDVSMNAHGVAVERILHRPIMSSLHAGWSFGGLAGAALVAAAGGAGVDPRVETLIADRPVAAAADRLRATARRGLGARPRRRPASSARPAAWSCSPCCA